MSTRSLPLEHLLRRKYDVPVSGHAHDGPSQACPDAGDRLSLDERPCLAGVVKFALGVVVVDQQRKAESLSCSQ
jgi:hypothetical protein